MGNSFKVGANHGLSTVYQQRKMLSRNTKQASKQDDFSPVVEEGADGSAARTFSVATTNEMFDNILPAINLEIRNQNLSTELRHSTAEYGCMEDMINQESHQKLIDLPFTA
jgi:hypothetical protein